MTSGGRLLTTCLAAGIALAGASGALAQSPEQAGDPRVRLVTGNDYRPYTDESLPEGGMITSLVRQAFAAAGWTVEHVAYLPWNRGYRDTLDGKFDAAFPYVPTPERTAEMRYSGSIFIIEIGVFFAPGVPPQRSSTDMLRGRRLCHPLGYNFSKEEREIVGMVIENPTIAGCMRMLQSQRADAVILSRLQGYLEMRAAFGDALVLAEGPSPLRRSTLHLIGAGGSARAAAVIAAFDRGLATLLSNRSWQRTVARHLGDGALNWTRVPE